MTDLDRFEELLRESLTARALTLDPAVEARLVNHDYGATARHQRHRQTLRLTLAGAFACLLAAVIALAVGGSGGNPTNAEASWSPFPSELSPASLAAATDNCFLGPQSQRKYLVQSSLGEGAFSYRPAVGEVRGTTQAFVANVIVSKKVRSQWGVDADHSLIAVCFTTVGQTSAGGGAATAQLEPTHVAPDAIQFTAVGLAASAQAGSTAMAGRVGRNVTAVWLTDRRGGPATIRATVSNGFYLVWWPATEHPQYIAIKTRRGIRSELLPASDRTEQTMTSSSPTSVGAWASQ